MIVLSTLIAFANAWPDNLTFDDRVFVDQGRFSSLGLTDLGRFFTEDLWAGSGVDSSLYRPLLLLSIAFQAWLFGDWLMGYHLVNILLHVLTTALVYGFVRHLSLAAGGQLPAAGRGALLAAVVFGVHPIHTEVVNSVFNSSEMFVSIGVVGGLWWLLATRDRAPVKAWAGLSLIYLLALLSRESGATLPALAVAMLWLCDSGPRAARFRKVLPAVTLLVPLAIYLLLRAQALDAPSAGAADPPASPAGTAAYHAAPVRILAAVSSVAHATPRAADAGAGPPPEHPPAKGAIDEHGIAFHPGRLLPAFRLWFDSLNIVLWPYPLQVYYDESKTNAWLALGVQMALLAAAFAAYLRKHALPLAGLAFFYVAILPSSRIFGASSAAPGLADRILYLPSVGLAIVLAAGMAWLVRRFGPRTAVVAAAAICSVLVARTWARNAEWASDTVLFESDYRRLESKDVILPTLIAAHLREDNVDRAVALCDEHIEGWRRRKSYAGHCGTAYGRAGRIKDAEQAYLAATRNPESRAFAHLNLANLYVHLERRRDAEDRFERAIAAAGQTFLEEYFRAVMLLQLYPNERSRLLEARIHLQKSLRLQPQYRDARTELDRLNARLRPDSEPSALRRG